MPSLKYLIVNSERVKQTKLDIANHSRLKSAAERKGQKIPALNGPTDNCSGKIKLDTEGVEIGHG